jgi:hypothetical protein
MDNYPLAEIRHFINELYSDEEIEILCFDHFPEVYSNFTSGLTKVQKILRLLSFCQSRERVAELLTILKESRSQAFTRQFPELLQSDQQDPTINEISAELQIEDMGFLDALEAFEDHFGALTECMNRVRNAIEEAGTSADHGTDDINALAASGNSTNARHTKRVINRTAEQLEVFARRIEGETPIFARAYKNGIDALARAATLLDDFPENRDEQIRQVLPMLQGLEDSIDSADAPLVRLRNSISGLPRITSALNRAKRHAAAALDALLTEFAQAKALTRDTRGVFSGLISSGV